MTTEIHVTRHLFWVKIGRLKKAFYGTIHWRDKLPNLLKPLQRVKIPRYILYMVCISMSLRIPCYLKSVILTPPPEQFNNKLI